MEVLPVFRVGPSSVHQQAILQKNTINIVHPYALLIKKRQRKPCSAVTGHIRSIANAAYGAVSIADMHLCGASDAFSVLLSAVTAITTVIYY